MKRRDLMIPGAPSAHERSWTKLWKRFPRPLVWLEGRDAWEGELVEAHEDDGDDGDDKAVMDVG